MCAIKETTPIESVSVAKKVNSGRKKIPRCAVCPNCLSGNRRLPCSTASRVRCVSTKPHVALPLRRRLPPTLFTGDARDNAAIMREAARLRSVHQRAQNAPSSLEQPWRPMDFTTRVASIMDGLLMLDGSLAPEVNFLRRHLSERGKRGSSSTTANDLGGPATACSSSTPAPTPRDQGDLPNPPGPPSGEVPSAFDYLMSRKRVSLPTTPAETPGKRLKATTAGTKKLSYLEVPTQCGGKQQQKGAAVRKLLEGAARAREVNKVTTANEHGDFAMLTANTSGPSKGDLLVATRAAKTAADAIFVGDGKRVGATIAKLQARPDFREAVLAMERREDDKAVVAVVKRTEAMECIVTAVSAFLAKAMATRGTRSSEDQNAADAVLCAVVNSSMFDKRLGREVGRLLKVQWKALHRGALLREKIDISPGWVRMCRAAYRSQLGHVSVVIIKDWLHSDDFSG